MFLSYEMTKTQSYKKNQCQHLVIYDAASSAESCLLVFVSVVDT